jgi:prepilin-type N-terminal cleavage/methylation domain-containing protein
MSFLNKIKTLNLKMNRGMTYVELIVVLGIFATMASIAIFNYGDLQDKIEIRNLASDIALKFMEAQKSAIAGKLHSSASAGWKPSYGVYMAEKRSGGPDGKTFYYFADLDGLKDYDPNTVCTSPSANECVERIQIGKNSFINSISISGDGCDADEATLTVTFTRPDLTPTLLSESSDGCNPSQATIVLESSKGKTSSIEIQPSGKIEIK